MPNRIRFVVEAAAAAIGPDRVGIRLSPGGSVWDGAQAAAGGLQREQPDHHRTPGTWWWLFSGYANYPLSWSQAASDWSAEATRGKRIEAPRGGPDPLDPFPEVTAVQLAAAMGSPQEQGGGKPEHIDRLAPTQSLRRPAVDKTATTMSPRLPGMVPAEQVATADASVQPGMAADNDHSQRDPRDGQRSTCASPDLASAA